MASYYLPRRHHGGCMIIDRTESFDPEKLQFDTHEKEDHYFIKNDLDQDCKCAGCQMCAFRTSTEADTDSLAYQTSFIRIPNDVQTWMSTNCTSHELMVNGVSCDAWEICYSVYLYDYNRNSPSKFFINYGYIPKSTSSYPILPQDLYRGVSTLQNYTEAVVCLFGRISADQNAYYDLYRMNKTTINFRYDQGEWIEGRTTILMTKLNQPIDYDGGGSGYISSDCYSRTLDTEWTGSNIFDPEQYNIITQLSGNSPKVYYINPTLTDYTSGYCYTDPSDFLVEAQNESYEDYFIDTPETVH